MTDQAASTGPDWLPTDDTPLTDAAIAYAEHGFRVLPVWNVRFVEGVASCMCGSTTCKKGKHPILNAWQKKASAEPDAVRDARRRRPDANVGLAMGGPERLVAVDIDGPAGRTSWAAIEAEHGPAPETLTSVTGRVDGGEHRIYRLPEGCDMKRLANRHAARYEGIDTRVDNGQVVVAPSMHESGTRYRWTVHAPVAEMPLWLFEALAMPLEVRTPLRAAPPPYAPRLAGDHVTPYLDKVLENACARVAGQAEGGRNGLLFAKACTVFEYFATARRDHLPAWNRLSDAGRACGLPAPEVSSVLSKAWRQAQNHQRHVPEPQRRGESPTAYRTSAREPDPEVARQEADVLSAAEQEEACRAALKWDPKTGQAKNTFSNICTVLRMSPVWAGRLRYNQMRVMPWLDNRALRDADISAVRESIECTYGFAPGHESVQKAISYVAEERSFHPVRDYLQALEWDGVPRLDRVATDFFGHDTSRPLVMRMLRCWFVSAVARALSPGCKVDTTLVLVGDQGWKKSTFFDVLGGEWFSDTAADLRSKDGVLQVHSAWIYEWGEIDRVTARISSSDVKSFLSTRKDHIRPPYGAGVVELERSGVITGSTNREFLDDETGSRRFWPVKVFGRIDAARLASVRDQLWAEAVIAYKAGEEWWLGQEDELVREVEASEHTVDNPLLEKIANYLRRPSAQMGGVTVADVLVGALGVDLGKLGRGDEMRVGKALKSLGWASKQETREGVRVRVYRSAASKTAQPAQPAQPGEDASCAPIQSEFQTDIKTAQPAQPNAHTCARAPNISDRNYTPPPGESLKQGVQVVQLCSDPPPNAPNYSEPGNPVPPDCTTSEPLLGDWLIDQGIEPQRAPPGTPGGQGGER